MLMTKEIARISCRNMFKAGDRIVIRENTRKDLDKRGFVESEGVIHSISSNLLTVDKGHYLESYTFLDIVLFNAIKKKLGRPRRVNEWMK
ncbi:MAG TPA: hypothetical protein GX707_08045 [Epulopiscium sp.]|nr:hypothetical protein [Candidatus Epulonipiscium sp.]